MLDIRKSTPYEKACRAKTTSTAKRSYLLACLSKLQKNIDELKKDSVSNHKQM